MKKIFVLIFLLNFNFSFGQKYQVENVVVYAWEDVIHANPDTIYGISFSKLKLAKLPDELKLFRRLKVLDVSKNKLAELPDFIDEFHFLEHLNLEKNKLINFPVRVCKDTSLRFLRLGKNLFETLPNSIELLTKLEYLDLYDTPIGSFPETLVKLTGLKEIDLTGIRFSASFQESWIKKLPNANFIFDSPCDCFD